MLQVLCTIPLMSACSSVRMTVNFNELENVNWSRFSIKNCETSTCYLMKRKKKRKNKKEVKITLGTLGTGINQETLGT
jgi:hypothetical protein